MVIRGFGGTGEGLVSAADRGRPIAALGGDRNWLSRRAIRTRLYALATRSFFNTPQHICPATMNVRPLFFEVRSIRQDRSDALGKLLVVRNGSHHSLAGRPNAS